MSIVLLFARLVLVVVFLVAGVGKLLDLKGSQLALRDFGVPEVLAAPLGVLLPLAELAVAVALIPEAWAWWGAIGAGVLLLLFAAGITYNLTLGRKPDCHCFGVFYSSAISKNTAIRNLVLAAVAAVVVAFGPSTTQLSMVAWIGTLTLAEGIGLVFGLLVAILLAAESWLLLEMMRQIGKLTLRLEAVEAGVTPAAEENLNWIGLPEEADAPAFELPDLSGELVSFDALLARGKPMLLVFTSAICEPCEALMPELGQWMRDYSDIFTFAVISQGSAELNRAKMTEHGVAPVLLQKENEVAEAYLVRGTPSAVILRTDGSIHCALAEGADAIRTLIEEETRDPVKSEVEMPTVNILGQPNETAFAEIGIPVPDIALPNLDGETIKLSDFLGTPMLLFFWNSGCGYCEAMLRDLKAWEARPPKGSPQFVFISAGPASDNKKQGLRSPMMLDSSFTIASLFKVQGTPSAVLIDEHGTLTNKPAVGSDPILALANQTARKYAKAKPKPAAV